MTRGFLSERLASELMAIVAPAETAFRSRWRLSTLERLSPELHARLVEQIDLYQSSLVTASDADAREQANAMVRGWRAACAVMEQPLQPDDAYLTGFDSATGTVVIVSDQRASAARAQVREGQRIVTVTPDEVAKLVAGLSLVVEAKGLFPDAELVGFARTCPDEEFEAGEEAARQAALSARPSGGLGRG